MAGHYAYYGITGNMRSLTRFVHEATHAWRRWLARRSNQGMTWQRFTLLLKGVSDAAPAAKSGRSAREQPAGRA